MTFKGLTWFLSNYWNLPGLIMPQYHAFRVVNAVVNQIKPVFLFFETLQNLVYKTVNVVICHTLFKNIKAKLLESLYSRFLVFKL